MPFTAPRTFPRQASTAQAIRTLFDTSHSFDAGLAGYDGPANPDEDGEGFRVVFDGRSVPAMTITGPDGSVEIVGLSAIRQLANAIMDAERMARRMTGEA